MLLDSEYAEDLLNNIYMERRGKKWVIVSGMRDLIRQMPGRVAVNICKKFT